MLTRRAVPVRVYFDASRLLNRRNSTPTGIDRVDMAYVRFFRAAEDFDLRLIRFDAFGPRLLPRHEAEDLIEQTVERWRLEHRGGGHHPAWRHLLEWLGGPDATPSPSVQIKTYARSPPGSTEPRWRRIMRAASGGRAERIRAHIADHPRLYLNTSHGRLFRGSVSRWLRATQIPAVFFLHDLIPIQFPEFNRPREPLRHKARLETISRHASCVLVNSQATASSLRGFLGDASHRVPPMQVAPLGIERGFDQSASISLTQGRPYFLVIGTIEPRKNHALILEVWRRWVREDSQGAARLVVVGRRGWLNQPVFNALEREDLSRHVVECGGLSDNQIASLLAGARALLCPSFAEGFSLPVVEALASGTPVIASDIDAHREVHQGCAELLPANDASAWLGVVQAYSRPDSTDRHQQLQRLESFKPVLWDDHFAEVLPLLHRIAWHG